MTDIPQADPPGRETVTVDALPPEAVSAAFALVPNWLEPGGQERPVITRDRVRRMLEAAAPHLAAAEREHHAVVKDAADAYAQKAADLHRENLHLRDENVALREVVAAERERILKEATSLRRSFHGKASNVIALEDLAALLRETGPPGKRAETEQP